MIRDALLGVYVVANAIGFFIGAFLITDIYRREPGWRLCVTWQIIVYHYLHDKVNTVGLAIAEIVVTVFMLPCTALSTAITVMMWLFTIIWKGFLYVFRRGDENAS